MNMVGPYSIIYFHENLRLCTISFYLFVWSSYYTPDTFVILLDCLSVTVFRPC